MVLSNLIIALIGTLKSTPNQLTVLVRNSNCKVIQMLLSKNIEGSFKNIRVGETFSSHLIHVSTPMKSLDFAVPEATVYRMGRDHLWVDSPSCKACKILSKNSTIPTTVLFIKGLGVVFSFISPGPITSKKIFEEMKDEGLDVEVLKRSSLNLRRVLTRKQRDVLFTAISMGYFSPRRDRSLNDIAEQLGLSKSTVSRHLRAAIRKLALSVPTEII